MQWKQFPSQVMQISFWSDFKRNILAHLKDHVELNLRYIDDIFVNCKSLEEEGKYLFNDPNRKNPSLTENIQNQKNLSKF